MKIFIDRLKHDKLYLFSFIVTLIFIGFFSISKLKQTEGYYDKKNDNNVVDNNVTPTVDTDLNKEEDNSVELDVLDYVGIYSREVIMSSPVVLDNTCSVTSYKVVYQIKKDKSITKYLINDCVGTIKIWSDKLRYVSSGGARYISANGINYLFSNTNMKEVDGEAYKIDDDISMLKENKKIKNTEVYFKNNNIIFMTNKDLILVKGNLINYQLSNNYTSNGGNLEKIVYKSDIENQFNFIIFDSNAKKECFTIDEISDASFKDGINYKIYTIKYNENEEVFGNPKEILVRDKSAGCDLYKEDLELLKE